LREATGGEAAFWLLPLILAAAAWGYRQVFLRVRREAARRHAPPQAAPLAPAAFSDAELSRYARHVALREVGGTGQRRLKEARVLVVGAGGLGAPALLYLGAAGVGTLGVIDDDVVESSNLARQVIFRDADLGRPKTEAAADALRAQNPFGTVRTYNRRLTPDIAEPLLADYDLVLDGSDDWDTRALVNRAAVATATPLLAGAVAQWEGSVALWDPARGGPCLACAYPEPPRLGPVADLRRGRRRRAPPGRRRHPHGPRSPQDP
jgi:molybdopterin/thiamine biosynthesis adenylyltransferase